MMLPFFSPGEDPGSSFSELLRRLDRPARLAGTGAPEGAIGGSADGFPRTLPTPDGMRGVVHGTTIAALLFAGGIVMAGDRRATEGHSIAHRGIEKVFPADRHSAVGIAGAAGPAVEMVRLFQTQLEHYEKVEGSTLSLEGKANQLAQMVRANLPFAMEGLGVLPLFGGYDQRRRVGRIFSFDLTGGRYEELEFHATGSGGRDAKGAIKLGYSPGMSEEAAVELVVKALYQAADEDSATGGPDPLRGIYPVVAVVDEDGYRRLSEEAVAERFAALVDGLRRPAHPEQPAALGTQGVDAS
jgi:proteasome beta subunit